LYTISIETNFRASHQLTLSEGRKEALHKHDWQVRAEVCSDRVNNLGLVMDFHRLKRLVDDIVADFDSRQLDEFDYFQRNSSSAESVSKYIYEKLEGKLPKGVRLKHVRVVEERGCSAKFSR